MEKFLKDNSINNLDDIIIEVYDRWSLGLINNRHMLEYQLYSAKKSLFRMC